jgi:curli production assembly/transport component CsgF
MFSHFSHTILCLLPVVLLLSVATQAYATEMVYAPINPSFGGNPNNAFGLMSIAQAQNGFKAPVDSPVQAFNLNLQRAILSRLSSQAMTTMFDSSRTLTAGNYDTVGYTIVVTDDGDSTLHITTTEKSTGNVATFNITSAAP